LLEKQLGNYHHTHDISKSLLLQPEEDQSDLGLLYQAQSPCSGQLLNILSLAASSVMLRFCT
jgi:hypothetical protein